MIRVYPLDPSRRSAFADRYGTDHLGTDIFAEEGTPVLAVDDGRIREDTDPKGGQVVYLTSADGQKYYYAHLLAWAGGPSARNVRAGEVIGYVGTTGNAAGEDPHLHFEIHPRGDRDTVDPYPELMAVSPQGSLRLPVPVAPLPALTLPAGGMAFGLLLLFGFLALHESRGKRWLA